jgi:hypothetical protein
MARNPAMKERASAAEIRPDDEDPDEERPVA